jgi:hypothetical protein
MDNKTNCIKKGGKKPHAHLLPMMVLVLFGMIALVGVAAADNIFAGTPPKTVLNGTVSGDVDVQMAPDPWNAGVTYTTRDPQHVWGNFSLKETPTDVDMEFARLYVVVYGGSMTANYTGNLTVQLYNGNNLAGTLVDYQPLNLVYDNRSVVYNRTAYNTSVIDPLVNLSRVTSDYIAVFDINDNISGLSTNNLNVSVTTYNSTGTFDGRVKEVKLVYGWNDNEGSEVKYWINEGHDPITYYGTPGYYNKTWFYDTGELENYEANLWVDYLAGTDGVYRWNNIPLDDVNAPKPTVLRQGKYAGLNHLEWTNEAPGMNDNNKLEYSRGNNNWYKIVAAVLTIK